jgi:short-subunit dehydrogenase
MSWLPAPGPDATCLVTGASSGIGAAIARELAGRGHGVTLVARREGRLRSLAERLHRQHLVQTEALMCDLADAEQRAALFERLTALRLRVDVLVNCAGIGTYGHFVELDPAREVDQVRLMCEAVVDLCRAFAPTMATRHSGAILIVSSALGFQPIPGYATYGAAKSFEIGFGEALRAELRRARVAVTTLCPGPVETEFFHANGPQPLQRVMPRVLWTSPDAVARAAANGLARNRRVVLPGGPMRALMAAGRVVPRTAAARAVGWLLGSYGTNASALDFRST